MRGDVIVRKVKENNFIVKHKLLKGFASGCPVLICDPDNEYKDLANHIGLISFVNKEGIVCYKSETV